jgi:nicotinamide mononucleotide (NMN) deamidase PncC
LDLIERLHQQPHQFVIAITGGGTSAISELLAIPGASNTLLESMVPYSQESLKQYLGFDPLQAVSQNTARQMAMRAYLRAKKPLQLQQIETEKETIGVLSQHNRITTPRNSASFWINPMTA